MSGVREGTLYLDLTSEYPDINAFIKDKRLKTNGLPFLIKRATILCT